MNMSKITLVALAFVVALGLGLNGYAQTAPQGKETNQYTRDMNQYRTGDKEFVESMKSMRGEFRGSDLIGAGVENRQGESLGKISDLAVDPRTNRVDFAVLSHGGALGIGEKYIAIPLSAFSVKMDKNNKLDKLVLDMSKDKLAQAPNFDKDHWPNQSEAMRSYRYFGQTPYWHGKTTSKSMEHKTNTQY